MGRKISLSSSSEYTQRRFLSGVDRQHRLEEFGVRTVAAQRKRRASSKSLGRRDPSLRWPHLYDLLIAKGYSKEKAARISNSRVGYRKKGRLVVKKGPKSFAAETTSLTPAQTWMEQFACHSKACAPPPAGSGGSKATGGGGSGSGGGSGGGSGYTDREDQVQDYEQRKRAEMKASRPQTFTAITAAQARGDSRPVSKEEFQEIARKGQAQLDKLSADSSPTTGLDKNWKKIKDEAYAEVQKEWGGATVDSHTGEALPQGADAYAITVKGPGTKTVSVPENASKEEFDAAMDKAKEQFGPILERQKHNIGIFHDDENKRIDIDPVLVVTSRADVDTIGAATHAIGGAYNFKDGNGYWPPHVAG